MGRKDETFDAQAEVERIRARRTEARWKLFRKSRLDRYRAELLAMRQAIQMHLGIQLEVIKSELETVLSTRSYTPAQIERIASAQTERNSLATQITYAAGLRAHELFTLQPASERQASTHREWSNAILKLLELVKLKISCWGIRGMPLSRKEFPIKHATT